MCQTISWSWVIGVLSSLWRCQENSGNFSQEIFQINPCKWAHFPKWWIIHLKDKLNRYVIEHVTNIMLQTFRPIYSIPRSNVCSYNEREQWKLAKNVTVEKQLPVFIIITSLPNDMLPDALLQCFSYKIFYIILHIYIYKFYFLWVKTWTI